MSYTNATFYLDYEGGSDTARTALTTVTAANPSGTITRMTKVAHGLVTGAVVDLTLFTSWLNAAWKITVVDADNFDLDGAVWQATADNSGTATPRGGSSKADAWKTITSGVTSARHAAGDTIRMMASPDETSIGNATWNQNSKTITLAGAVTANITDCETAWTASANVTSTADTSLFKENTKSAKHVIAAGFATGLASYFATGTLDLSGYQQVSFWVYNTAALAASTLSLRLCTDTIGAVSVHTIAIPAIPSTGQWVAVTVDLGGNLSAVIASVALYADLDPGSTTIQLDNIIACKASSSADSLSLTSLIGKAHNVSWVASTAYSSGAIRIPTPPNRNGLRYTASAGTTGGSEPTWPTSVGVTVADGSVTWTCEGVEDTWYGIQSINGATVKVDTMANSSGSAGRGYGGETETVATYKRETIKPTMRASSTDVVLGQTNAGGAADNHVVYSGGWNRADMTTQTGQSWFSGGNGLGYMFYTPSAYITLSNFNSVRSTVATLVGSDGAIALRNCHFNNFTTTGLGGNSANIKLDIVGMVCNNNGVHGAYLTLGSHQVRNIRAENNGAGGLYDNSAVSEWRINRALLRNNASYGIVRDAGVAAEWIINNLTTASNASGGIQSAAGRVTLNNASIAESTEFSTLTASAGYRITSNHHDGSATSHLIWMDGGTVVSATDQRNTASGISWKFRPTAANRTSSYPLKLSVAKIACTSGVAVSVNIYTRRDNTNIKGRLCIEGGQIAGVDADITVACEPSINTWTNSGTLTFTPTEDGVVEILFKVWDGVGGSNSYWIDDLQIA